MTSTRTASCSCGQLSATCEGEPAWVSVCHCLACQARTGSVFGVQAHFDRASVAISGESTLFERVSDEGFDSSYRFCPRCGSTVAYEIERRPGMISVPVGAFGGAPLPAPTRTSYDERRHSWVKIDAGSGSGDS